MLLTPGWVCRSVLHPALGHPPQKNSMTADAAERPLSILADQSAKSTAPGALGHMTERVKDLPPSKQKSASKNRLTP